MNKIANIKHKKSKSKNDIDFGLIHNLEFGLITNYINNDNILNTINEKKDKKNKNKDKKHKTKDKQVLEEQINLNENKIELKTNIYNNAQSTDSDYLEKKFLKNNTLINKKNEIFSIDLNDNKKDGDVDEDNDDNLNNKNNSKNIQNNEIKKININEITKSLNPLIQNEVIWYSHELNSDELEFKYKNKHYKNELNKSTNININNLSDNSIINEQKINNNEIDEKKISNDKIDEQKINNNEDIYKLSILSDTLQIEKYITDYPQITMIKKVYRRVNDCKRCLLECKNMDYNVFEWNISCDPNCSSYKIFNNNIACSHISNIIFMADGKIYNPDVVEIYVNGKFLKKNYSDVINNLQNEKMDKTNIYYNIADGTFPLTSNTIITIKIQDTKQIEKVFFNILLEKLCSPNKIDLYLNENFFIEFYCTTHELLYTGNESNITIELEHGYYQDIYIFCEDIVNNINSISLTNSDVILFQNVPVQLLEHTPNLICYSTKINDIISSGIKIDSDFNLKIGLNKSNPNSKVKIYGNKLFILKSEP